MSITYRVLGQINPPAATDTTLYTVPTARTTVVSTLAVANLGASTLIRVAIRPTGEALAPRHYLIFDAALNAHDSALFTLGITLAATDVVTVRAGTANVAFSLFGGEQA